LTIFNDNGAHGGDRVAEEDKKRDKEKRVSSGYEAKKEAKKEKML